MSDAPKPLGDFFDGGDTIVFFTMIDGRPSSRPMTVAGVAGGRLDMLVDTTADWYAAVSSGDAIAHVALSDVRHNEYAALNGTVTVTRDRTEIERLWNPGASAFFEGKDDPNLAVLHFVVAEGQYWDSPSGRIGSLLAMVKAAVGGDEASGEHGSIAT